MRIMRTVVTENSEYRFEDNVCIGVRPVQSTGWLKHHPAVGHKLLGAVKTGLGFTFMTSPGIGMQLLFSNDLVTSPVVSVCLP